MISIHNYQFLISEQFHTFCSVVWCVQLLIDKLCSCLFSLYGFHLKGVCSNGVMSRKIKKIIITKKLIFTSGCKLTNDILSFVFVALRCYCCFSVFLVQLMYVARFWFVTRISFYLNRFLTSETQYMSVVFLFVYCALYCGLTFITPVC